MTGRDYIYWLVKSIMAKKLRSMLTIIGFAIGIGAVAGMSMLGESFKKFVLQEFSQFGTQIMAITPGKTETFGLSGLLATTRPLTLQDSKRLKNLPFVEHVIPVTMGNAAIKSRGYTRYTDVAGVSAYANLVWKLAVAQGTFLPNDDIERPRAFAVLGSKVAEALFPDKQPIGEKISIASQKFRVVGVMEAKGEFLGMDLDDLVYIPTQSALQLFNRTSLMEVDIVWQPHVSTEMAKKQVSDLLIRSHGREDFTIITQDEMLTTLDQIMDILKVTLTALGVISLFVAAISIATIFTINLEERKSELGLLRALGCQSHQLRNLFLFEAIGLSVAGSMLAFLLLFSAYVVKMLLAPQLPFEFSMLEFIGSLLLAIVIGGIAGVFPAIKAATIDPVAALRDE